MLEISRFSGRAARHRLGYTSRGSPRFQGGSPRSPLKCLGAPRGRFSLPRKLILGNLYKIWGFRGSPTFEGGSPKRSPGRLGALFAGTEADPR